MSKVYDFKNHRWVEEWIEPGHKLVDGRETKRYRWFKYGCVEMVDDDVISGEIGAKYRGRTYDVAIIANELFVTYSSSNLKGSKFFSTTTKVSSQPFDKPFDEEELESILSWRSGIDIIDKYMEYANKLYENWKEGKK